MFELFKTSVGGSLGYFSASNNATSPARSHSNTSSGPTVNLGSPETELPRTSTEAGVAPDVSPLSTFADKIPSPPASIISASPFPIDSSPTETARIQPAPRNTFIKKGNTPSAESLRGSATSPTSPRNAATNGTPTALRKNTIPRRPTESKAAPVSVTPKKGKTPTEQSGIVPPICVLIVDGALRCVVFIIIVIIIMIVL